MTTQLSIAKDDLSTPTFITKFSNQRASLVMAADTDATIPVPIDARFAVIFYDTGKDIFVSEAEITLPVSDTPVTTAGVLLKPSVDVTDIVTLHFKSNEVAFVSVEFYT